jgi:hypothetical protein
MEKSLRVQIILISLCCVELSCGVTKIPKPFPQINEEVHLNSLPGGNTVGSICNHCSCLGLFENGRIGFGVSFGVGGGKITMKRKNACWTSRKGSFLTISIVVVILTQLMLNLRVTATTKSPLIQVSPQPQRKHGVPPQNAVRLNATSSPLELYNPARFPVLSTLDMAAFPIKVGIVTIHPLVGEAMHYLYDGVMGSEMLQLVGIVSLYGVNQTEEPIFEPSDASVWIVDGARVAKLQRSFLDQLLQSESASWKVLMIDFSDRFQFQLRKYQKLNVWDQSRVRLAVRSIVQGRHYNSEKQAIARGQIAPNLQTAGGPMLHYPYAVRSDVVRAIQQIVGVTDNSTSSLEQAIGLDRLERPIDVLHLWNVSFKEGKSKLRNDVSKLVRSWNGSTRMATDRTMKTSIDEQGPRRQVGRNAVDPNYVRALLSAKIVVVTQKDDWEDHYRLMEALVCGPLVLADAMLAPPRGLVHGETIVFFESLQDLEQHVLYYLTHEDARHAIAQKGRRLVMERHRSWHRLEELLFGQPLTKIG